MMIIIIAVKRIATIIMITITSNNANNISMECCMETLAQQNPYNEHKEQC